jgi:hypothetical protein
MDINIGSLCDSQALSLTSQQILSDSAIDELNRKSADHSWDEVDSDGRGWLPTADGSFMHLARAARDNGYMPLVPLHSAQSWRGRQGDTKVPKILEWQKLATNFPSNNDIRSWLLEDPNIGFGYVHNSALLVFDFDSPDALRTAAMIDWLFGNIPGSPPMMRTSKIPKTQLYYRAGRGCHQEKTPEIFHSRGQTVLFGVHPKFQVPFSWRYGSPAYRHIDDLPVCEGMDLVHFLQAWGGPSGNGDPTTRFGKRGGGIVLQLLKFAQDNRMLLMDLDDLIKVIQIAPSGSRHNLAVGAVSYARHEFGAEIRLIERTVGAAYFEMLKTTMAGRQLNKHINDFNRLVGWAAIKVNTGGN